jgi:DNA-binding response OmpR family regulator
MDGLEFLQWVRNQAALKQVRFIMLSSSDAERDVNAARTCGVDDYQVKPSGIGALTRLVEKMETPRGGEQNP